MTTENLLLTIRHANDTDVAFIFSSWLKSFRDSGFLVRAVPNTIYFTNHHKILQNLIKRSTVFVACDPKDSSNIYGYVVAETISGSFVLHFIYVKQSFRKLGVGKALFNSFPHDGNASCCSHLTKMGEKFLLKYNMIYHPYTMLLDEVANAAE